MSVWLSLALALCLAASGRAQAADDELENGGTIIFHSHYMVDFDRDPCRLVVVVTSADAIAILTHKLRTSDEPLLFRVEGTEEEMRLKPMSQGRLGGRFVTSKRRVVVVSKEYADAHGIH